MNALIIMSALEYIELSTVIAILVVIASALLSYQISSRRPLYYNLFVVEMHTWTTRRMVQEFSPPVTWERLVQRMRARAPRIQGEQRIAISDTNIVIQSPNTVIDSPAPARSPDVDLITLWDIEMPPPSAGHVPDASRDSQYAAAAAIAILARGDDASLVSRVFRNQERSSRGDPAGIAPALSSSIQEEPNPPRHDYVTTDVTYTTPSIDPNMQHHLSTRTSNLTQTHPPTNQIFRDHPEQPAGIEDDDEDEEDDDDDDDDETDENDSEDDDDDENDENIVVVDGDGPIEPMEQGEIEQRERERRAREEPEDDDETNVIGASPHELALRATRNARIAQEARDAEETRLAQQTSETECPVIEGPSEGKILVKLKFMNDTEKITYASLADTVGKFKVDHFTNSSNNVIRLIYRGQLLREDNRTLEEYGIQQGSIVHCHISTTPYARPGVATLPPIVNDTLPRRRSRRQGHVPGDPMPPNPTASMNLAANEDMLARRRAAQDRNVGRVYILLSTMVPILSGVGLAFFRPDRLRDLLRPATIFTISQWLCNLFADNGLLEPEEEEPESNLQASTLFWIFGGQVFAVSIFLYYCPDVFDRVGLSIFIIVFLYFVFVVYSRHRRLQPEVQNEMMENQIIQESISLL